MNLKSFRKGFVEAFIVLSLLATNAIFAQVTAITRIGLANGQLTLGTSVDSAYRFPALRGHADEALILGSGGLISWAALTLVTDTLVLGADTLFVREQAGEVVADSLNPLINRIVLDYGIVIEAVSADTALVIVGPLGGDFTVIIHDTSTTVTSDSAFEVYDDDITFVWIDEDGALQKATTGFPTHTDGLHDTTVVELAAVSAASNAIVWINTHYGSKQDWLISTKEFLEEWHHYSTHSGFEIGEGTSADLGFDFGAAGTKNVLHAIHGWVATHADDADLTFVDDVYSAGSGTTFDNTKYGNGVAMSTNYYSKFRLWMAANNLGINEFHITRSTSEWADVAQARAASWPTLPAGYEGADVNLIGVVYKKSKDWDDIDDVKDWIVTTFTAVNIELAGGYGLGVDDIGGLITDSLHQVPLYLREVSLGSVGGVGGGVTIASGATFTINPTANFLDSVHVGLTSRLTGDVKMEAGLTVEGEFTMADGMSFVSDSIVVDSVTYFRDVSLGSTGGVGGGVTIVTTATFLDSVKIGTFEGTTFRDLNVKQTDANKAIRIERENGADAYEIGVNASGNLNFYDDDGSISLAIFATTNQVKVYDSLLVSKTSRFTGDVKMEGDLNVEGQFTSTLSLDLEYYFGRSVRQLMATVGDAADDYADWANNKWDDAAAGVHSDNTTDYLTDHQSITLTDGADDDGMYLDITDVDLTLFADGDTSVMADYINFSIYILTQDITDLNDTDGLGFILACDAQGTLTNYFYYLIDDSDLSNGWNHFKIAKSAFTEAGTGDWSAITGISLYFDGAPDAEVIVSIDNIQMVRKDPDAAEPNPFQSEDPDGTWVADWTQEGTGNSWLVEESSRLSVMFPGTTVNVTYLNSATAFGDYAVSGKFKLATGVNSYSPTLGGVVDRCVAVIVSNTNQISYYDSAAAATAIVFVCDPLNELFWKATKKGTSLTMEFSHDGISYVSGSNACYTAAKKIILSGYEGQRLYSFGLSAVAYAAEAGVAQRLKNGLTFDLSGNLTTHGSWDGITARVDVDVNTVGFSGALHMDADGNLIDADADGTTTLPCFGMAVEAGVGSGKLILLQGKIVNTSWNWTIGAPVYISPTAGQLSATVASGDYIQQVGIAIGADAIYFNPQDYDAVVVP